MPTKKRAQAKNVFSRYAQDWLNKRAIEGRSDGENTRMLNVDILPYIGDMPITSLNPEQLEKDVTDRIIQRGAIALAGRVRMVIKMILDIPLKKWQKMMQLWADYLDALRLDQDVTRFKPQDDEMDNIIQFTRRESA